MVDTCTSPTMPVWTSATVAAAESSMTMSLSDLMKEIIEGARQLENISLSQLPTSEGEELQLSKLVYQYSY